MGKIIDRFKTHFAEGILSSHENYGDETILVTREVLSELLRFAKEDPELRFDLMMDICGVDYLGQTPRFEVVYHLYSVPKNHRIRLKVRIPEDDCWVPTCLSLWKAADWFERETYDMVGIRFEGHPNLKRVLLLEAVKGPPLGNYYRKKRGKKFRDLFKNPGSLTSPRGFRGGWGGF